MGRVECFYEDLKSQERAESGRCERSIKVMKLRRKRESCAQAHVLVLSQGCRRDRSVCKDSRDPQDKLRL